MGRRGSRLVGLALVAAACGDDAMPVGATTTGSTGDGPGPGTTTPLDDDGIDDAGSAASSSADASTSGASTPGDSTTGDDIDASTSTGSGSDSGASTGPGGETSDDETTAAVEPPVVELQFTEVAALAGIDYDHGDFNMAPNCLIDQVGSGTNGFCIAERMSGAVSVVDYDEDGDYDVYASRIHGDNLLYENDGTGNFVDVANAAGLAFPGATAGTAWADIDNDGDQDLYLTALGGLRNYLFINDGDGHFSDQAIARGASLKSDYQHSPTSVAFGDYDLDGYLDLYVAEWKTDAGLGKQPSHSRLLHNLGASAPGHYEDVTLAAGVEIDEVWQEVSSQAGTFGFSPAFADLDGDRWPDLVVVSDFDCSRLFWNDGDGTFTDGTVAAGVGIDHNGMGSTFGDYDRDGDLDWFVTAITAPGGPPENRLYRYDGDRVFTELAAIVGVGFGGWGWGTTFFDPDNDGDLDLAMGAGYYYTAYLEDPNLLWRNEGNGLFSEDLGEQAGISTILQARGVVAFDYDGDHDEDLLIVNNAEPPSLFRNETGSQYDWLRVKVTGTTSNRDGVGAQVRVRLHAGSPPLLREIGSASHFMGQAPKTAHFGAGFGSDPIHEVRVYWPATDQEQVFTDVPRNSELVVVEP